MKGQTPIRTTYGAWEWPNEGWKCGDEVMKVADEIEDLTRSIDLHHASLKILKQVRDALLECRRQSRMMSKLLDAFPEDFPPVPRCSSN